ncbi:protein EVI2B [Thamnophis elegans]|uniref:protein EVI2B n=1 Tax=Thamnophis elegans TaxID=35005 RepID=UPI0013769033|nr:protein EVI2B [Thamnophis elegans]
MAVKALVLIFIYGQLWWNHTAGKGPAGVSLNAEPQSFPSQGNQSKDPTKNVQQRPSSEPQLTTPTKEPKLANEHLIAAVAIGVILLLMIVIIIAIFLWRQRKRSSVSLPHWAGRSPFADGDVPDITVDKEPLQGIKRMSVLSLPWKFSKDTQLLDNAEGQLSESRKTLEVPQGSGEASTESESSHTATATLNSSASSQTQISEEPNNLTDISLQPESPRLQDSPPSASWPSGVNGDVFIPESRPMEQHVEIQSSIPPDLPQQNVDEAVLFPPPPEDFLCN